MAVTIQLVSTLVDAGVVLGAVVLVAMYVFIIFDLVHRTVVSMLAATAAIAILAILDERPALEEIITWIDIETLTLLFSMMVIVSIVSETGVFNYVGFLAFKWTRGRVWPLLIVLCSLTGVISAFLDNVTTILLMTPIIIQLCEAVGLPPTKVLIANVIFSNIGGAATPIGDPPNVLIASDPGIQSIGHVTFGNFMGHVSICVLIVAFVSMGLLRLLYGKMDIEGEGPSREDKQITELKHEILIWHRTAQSMPTISREEAAVKKLVEKKIMELKEELAAKEEEALASEHASSTEANSLEVLEANCRIADKPLLIKSAVVLAVTIVLFFLQNFPSFHLSLGWTALLGAITLLVLADKLEVESVFGRVEWSTLIFFATLFVVMEALDELGLLKFIGSLVESLVTAVAPEYQLAVAICVVLWVSGLASAFVDNIPFTAMMIPVIKGLGESSGNNLPLQPLVWALSLGACLGGNGTLIGASANVVCAGVAEQHGYKFTFVDFFKVGFPLMLVSLVIANVYLLICHVALGWNGA